MTLKDFLEVSYSPLSGISTKISIYVEDKCDIPLDEYEINSTYGFSPDALIISVARFGMERLSIFSEEILNKKIVAIYPENNEINIALGGDEE